MVTLRLVVAQAPPPQEVIKRVTKGACLKADPVSACVRQSINCCTLASHNVSVWAQRCFNVSAQGTRW